MELLLLRHAPAVERGSHGFADDFSRPLTVKGRRQCQKTAAAMKKMTLEIDLILSSPLVRARETAEIVATALKLTKHLNISSALAPGGRLTRLVHEMAAMDPLPQKILLVGHEPDLSGFVSQLVTGHPHLQMEFKKGGLCKLEMNRLRPAKCATLCWLLTPKQMKLMA